MTKWTDKNWWGYLWDVILRRPNIANGFIDYQPTGTDEIHFEGKERVLGNAKVILRPDGDWRLYRPMGEHQARTNETMSCVSFSATNALEEIVLLLNSLENPTEEQKEIIKIFKHFGILHEEDGAWRANSSDRYIAKLSNTSYRGNTQKAVADAIRHYGLVPEAEWPWVEGWNNYFSSIPQSMIDKGKQLVEYLDFNYEWAMFNIAESSLKYAPLQTSVFAWNGTQNGVYYRTSNPRNHATIRDAKTNVYHINDSYPPFDKELALNFNFGNDLLYTIHLKKPLTLFNQKKIDELRAKGIEYVLLVDDHKTYTRGLWKLTENGMVKIDDKNLPEEYKAERNNAFIRERAEDGTLKPYSPVDFSQFIV